MTLLFDFHCHFEYKPETPPPHVGGKPSTPAEPFSLAGRLICGIWPEDWPYGKNAAETWAGTIPAFGLHPWDTHTITEDDDWLETLEQFLVDTPGSWVGEIGLDQRRKQLLPGGRQILAFTHQLRLAAKLGRRLNLHCVGAWEEILTALDSQYLDSMHGAPFIVHTFGGPYQCIKPLRERGAYFTVGPLAAQINSQKTRERVALLPAERIVLESDAFLIPDHDALDEIREALVWLAEVRNTPVEELMAQIARNGSALLQEGV